MARKTQKISLKQRIGSWKSNRRAREKRLAAIRNWNWVAIVKVAAVVCFLVGSGAFLRYAEAYVKTTAPAQEGGLILVDVPDWVKLDLQYRVAQVAGGTRFPLTEKTASDIADNLASMPWLHEVSVRVTHDSVLVRAQWRKPVVVIKIREEADRSIYVDKDLVVMDYMPMPDLPIVEAKQVSQNIVPLPGQKFDQGDLAAAVTLALLLNRVDTALLEQITSIDVSNFKGRKNAREPHITLRSKDDVEIIWGAEFGEYAKYLEASDQEKLGKLYTHYKEFGSFGAGGSVKYVNLRNPQDRVSQPIDRYR
ncbi:MAG: hypothetical protein ABFE13_21685 [Phycisphaerales bacterium]